MGVNTGTGGSYYDIQAFGCRFYDHTGVLAATIGNNAGGINLVTGNVFKINAFQVVGSRQAAIPDTSGATLANLEIEVNKIKAMLRVHGLIA